MSDLHTTLRENYHRALETVAASARKAGRDPDSVRIVVVTKNQPLEVVRAAVEAGARLLGENYAEEAVDKILALKGQSAVEWHMIGHVQSRKAGLVAEHFALFQSLDSLKLAERVDRLAAGFGRVLPVLLEFNLGDESSKSGWVASDESRWPELLPEVQTIAALAHVQVRGLMTMPPLFADPEAARPYFQRLRRLQDFLAGRVPTAEWRELSMGTSADYPAAVEEGATLVRIGQAILGPRPRPGG